MIDKILKRVTEYNKAADSKRVAFAFNYVKKKSKEHRLDVNRVIKVLENLLPLRPDEESVISILLIDLYIHDFIDDGEIFETFGEKISDILNGFRKIISLNYKENDQTAQLEIFRKLFLAMAKDIRVVLIAVAYRLFLMKNLSKECKEPKTRLLLAKETLDVYVPLVARLGVYSTKTDLEDMTFKSLHPIEYNSVYKQVVIFERKSKQAISEVKRQLKALLAGHGYEKVEIEGRIKSIYSIYKKLSAKGHTSIDELYDIFAMRIVLPTSYDEKKNENFDDLYTVLGLIHSEWKPLSSRFKDYIAVPKPNGYRSLHTVVLGLTSKEVDKPIEIQIRSESMHREAEYGISSHWIYKQSGSYNLDAIAHQVEWLKRLESVRNKMERGVDVLSEMEVDLFSDRIFALTPRGEVKDLPAGSTPIDFAYAVHTEVGNRCVLAKVNEFAVPLDYTLSNGDVVEIVTKKDSKPKLQWLSFVKTDMAKNKIKAHFTGLNKENNVKEGKKMINAQLIRLGKSPLDQSYSVLKNYAGRNLSLSAREHLLEEVGKGAQLANDIIRKIFSYSEILKLKKIAGIEDQKKKVSSKKEKSAKEYKILIGGESGLPVKMAKCCEPKPEEEIVAYVTRGNRFTIHSMSCLLLDSLDPNRIVIAEWSKGKEEKPAREYRVEIKLTVIPRVGLIRDITSIISDMQISIVDMKMEGDLKKSHFDYFTLEMNDPVKFNKLMDKLENVMGVKKVVKA